MKLSGSRLAITVLSLANLFGKVLGAVTFVDPVSGSVVANFEGTNYAATLICNVSNAQGVQISTQWTLGNFRGEASELRSITSAPELFSATGDPIPSDPRISYRNQLQIVRMTAELDRVQVYCGGNEQLQQANFTLRIYRPPKLRDNFLVKIEENSEDVPIDLRQDPAAYPEPMTSDSFEWSKDGLPLTETSPRVSELTYSRVSFATVTREDAGNYVVSATNYVSGSTTQEIGSDTGSLRLDVIYGPSFEAAGPTHRYALLNDGVSLVCGTGLDSNPQATVTWTAPDGTTIVDNDRYDLDNGPDIVRLSIVQVTMSDVGLWTCDVTVHSNKYVVDNGGLVMVWRDVVGTPIHHSIHLTAVVPPDPPNLQSVDAAQITSDSLYIHWNLPSQINSRISYYLINARNLLNTSAEVIVTNTSTNATFFNVTGLLPGTTYELTVVAVSQGGDVIGQSQPSNSVTASTRTTVPGLTCNKPISAGGDITAAWSYVHTGGLHLTNVSVFYTFTEGLTINRVPVSVRSINTLSATVHNLTSGFEYSFNVTAENGNGASSILCGPTFHAIGRPVMPTIGALMYGSHPDSVNLTIKTVASGVNETKHRFQFIITPIVDGARGSERVFALPNYQSGHFETIEVGGLERDGSYIFGVVAMNIFGMSKQVYSASIILEGGPHPLTPLKDSSIDAIIGGVIGGLTLTSITVLIIVIIVASFVLKKKAKKRVKRDVEQ